MDALFHYGELLGLIVQGLLVAYNYGKVAAKVGDLEKRLERIERKLDAPRGDSGP